MRSLLVVGLVPLLACRDAHRSSPAAAPPSPELRARELIEALARGNPEPLADLITPGTTWDGITPTGGIIASNTTAREDIARAGAAASALVGDFRSVAFVWTERDYVYVLTEHAAGDFVYMVGFDAEQRLRHLTFSTPHNLPASSSCSPGAMRLLDDGTHFVGPTQETPATVAIVGMLGGRPGSKLANDLASELTCRGIASIVVPGSQPLRARPAGVRLVVVHASDRALVPEDVEPMLLEQVLPKPKRDSGRSVIESHHIAPPVVEQVAARARN